MQWVVLALVAVGLLLMATRYPKLAFGILGLLALLISLLLILDRGDKNSASTRAGDLELHNVQMTPGYADSYNFSGRIGNLSQATIRETSIQVTLQDCAKNNEAENNCAVIGEAVVRIPVTIPPGQARDFEENVYLGSSKAKQEARWEYLILDAQSR